MLFPMTFIFTNNAKIMSNSRTYGFITIFRDSAWIMTSSITNYAVCYIFSLFQIDCYSNLFGAFNFEIRRSFNLFISIINYL